MEDAEARLEQLRQLGKRVAELRQVGDKLSKQQLEIPSPAAKDLILLKPEQIKSILDEIPLPICRIPELRQQLHEVQKKIIRRVLESKKVSKHGIDLLRDRLKKHAMMGMIAPGTPLGLWCSDDLGASVMQGTLNTRHKAGSRQNASGGIRDQREIVLLSNRSKPTVIVFFEDRQTFYSIMETWRPLLVGIKLRQLYFDENDVIIETATTRPDWYDVYAKLIDDNWVEQPFTHRMVIKVRKDLIFSYKISLSKAVDILNTLGLVKKNPNLFRVIYSPLTFSPGEFSEIHILPNDDAVLPKFEGTTPKSLYILQEIRKKILSATISGIEGIKGIVPIVKRVHEVTNKKMTGAIKRETVNKESGISVLEINDQVTRIFGITAERIQELVEACGLEVTNVTATEISKETEIVPTKITIKLPAYNPDTYIEDRKKDVKLPSFTSKEVDGQWIITPENKDDGAIEQLLSICKTLDLDPIREKKNIRLQKTPKITALGHIEMMQSNDNDKRTAAEEAQREVRNKISRQEILSGKTVPISILQPLTPIEEANEYYYAEVALYKEYISGSNIKKNAMEMFVDIDGVDIYRSFSNFAREINGYLGIEGARSFLIQEIEETWINSGAPLRPISILTAVDAMTYKGTLTAFSHSGITSNNIGFMAKSTVHAAMKFLQNAAINSEVDHLKSTSTALMFGQYSALGTGLVKVNSPEYTPEAAKPEEENDFSDIKPQRRKYVLSPDDAQQETAIPGAEGAEGEEGE